MDAATATDGSPDDETRQKARDLAGSGLQLVQTGEIDAGLAKLAEALLLVPVPTIAIERAHAMVSVGRLTAATTALRETVEMAIPPWLPNEAKHTQGEAQKQAREELAALIKRVPKVKVVLLGHPAERVTIDGKPRSLEELKTEIMVDPGHHIFAAYASDVTARKEVMLEEGKALTVALRLESPPPVELEPPPNPEPQSPSEGISTLRLAGFITLGVGGLAVVGTAISWGLARDKASDLEPQCPGDRCNEALLGPGAAGEVDDYHALRTSTIVLGVVSGVLVATGLTLVLLPGNGGDANVSLQLSPSRFEVHARF